MAGVEKSRMDRKSEECLQTYIIDIEDTVEAKDVTAKLYAENIINREDKEKIEAGDTRKERIKRLIDIIVWRGSRSFIVFIQALEASGYKELALKLFKNIAKFDDAVSDEGSLSEKVESLRERVEVIETGVERSLVTKTEFDNLSADMRSINLKMQGLSSTLHKIEELSIASRENEVTLTTLRHQLEGKNQLLQAAREKIDELESKLDNMEAENALLRSDLKRQDRQLRTLRREVEDERLRSERIEKRANDEKRNTEAMFQKQGEQIEKMFKFQEEAQLKIRQLEQKQNASCKQRKSLTKKSIIPRNRIEDYKK